MADEKFRTSLEEYQARLVELRAPKGVEIGFDELDFYYVPDDAIGIITHQLTKQLDDYQQSLETGEKISSMVMVTMGALLPGVLMHDHAHGYPSLEQITYGTIGISCYAGPGLLLDEPVETHPLNINISGQHVVIGEDLLDTGLTIRYLDRLLRKKYEAAEVSVIAPYIKGEPDVNGVNVINFGVADPMTWLITPRERVETLVKRVPYWRDKGASLDDCRENLENIGYPDYLIASHLQTTYENIDTSI